MKNLETNKQIIIEKLSEKCGEETDDLKKQQLKGIRNNIRWMDESDIQKIGELNEYLDGRDTKLYDSLDSIEDNIDKIALKKTANYAKKNKKDIQISSFFGIAISILLLAIGLIITYCVLDYESTSVDTVYFVIESIKDILGGVGGGAVVYAARTKKTASKKRKTSVLIIALGLSMISLVGAGSLLLFAMFSVFQWSKWVYVFLEIGFILLTLLSLLLVINIKTNNELGENE